MAGADQGVFPHTRHLLRPAPFVPRRAPQATDLSPEGPVHGYTRTVGFSLLLAVLISASPASDKKEAATHYQRGISLYKESNYSAALSEFKAAHAALPSWEVLFNIGLCQRRLFQYGSAIRSFDHYLAEGGAKVPKDRRAAVDQELEQIRALTAPVAVIVNGASANVLVDGDPQGVTPLSTMVLLGPGKHVVRAEREGCAPDEKTIEVVSGQAQAVTLDPRSLTAPGHVVVECTPSGAMLAIDSDVEVRCPVEIDLKPGTHELVARADGFATQRTEVIVQPGQPRSVRLSLVSLEGATSRPFPVLGVTLAGGGLVLGGVGALFAVLAQGAAKDVTTLSTTGGVWDAKAVALQSTGQRNEVLGWTLIGVGAAAAVAGVATIVITSTRPVQVSLSVGTSGVFACGSF